MNMKKTIRPINICHFGNMAVAVFLALFFFIIPFFIMAYFLIDIHSIQDGRIPKIAFWAHRSLSPKYEKWARQRVDNQQAQQLSIDDISGTEWPLFGSVFYLLATESLQEEWKVNKDPSSVAPKVYAAGAIEAAAELVADPGHATWVKKHWGEDYLHRENVFYRMLLISTLTSYQKLLHNEKYTSLLTGQVETLSKEIDDSPYGLLDDYPGQCYPTDIVAAIAAINQADSVLGTDHSTFIKRSIRAFEGNFVDATGLPPYEADSASGIIGDARGCSSQWITVWTPKLWPDYSKELYANFDKHFWQKRCTAVGFREFPKGKSRKEWYIDVDSGPVLAGFGAAATAFGLGAARANGRFDHAYPLTAEAIVFSWPLPNGTLAAPRILSNMTHAPYLGEAGLLFALTCKPNKGSEITTGGQIPILVFLVLAGYLIVGIIILAAAIVTCKHWKKLISEKSFPLGRMQLVIWFLLIATGIVLCGMNYFATGMFIILSAQFLPRSWGTIKIENTIEQFQK